MNKLSAKRYPLNAQRGFTLIELLIVITVTVILVVATVPIYGNLQLSAQLNENSSQIIQTLRTARERGVAGVNNEQHGVQFQFDRYVLFQNATGTAFDRETVLDKALTLSWSLSGGVDEINFSKGLGVPTATGTITISHDVKGTRTITINELGVVEEN